MNLQFYGRDDVQMAHDSVYTQGRTTVPCVLPPGLSQSQFDDVCDALGLIVGADQIYTGTALTHFSDPFSSAFDHTPSAAICPKSTEEIQKILKLVNENSIPLWTCSRGKNLGYGGPSPRVKGSVVMSLHRMDRILEVNEKSAYAVVEPGVTFFDLYSYCHDKKLSLWPSVPGISWGSVLGNTLDRGFGYTAMGDHHTHICGMEILLPDGDMIRTGQWAANDSPSAFSCKASFGPQLDGLFLQSNLGIVTKLAIWVQPQPETFMSVVLHMDEIDDLEYMIEILGDLRRDDIMQNDPFITNIIATACRQGPKRKYYQGSGVIPHDVLQEIMEDLNVGYWRATFHFYGIKDMVMSRLTAVEATVNRVCPRARLLSKLFEGKDGKRVDSSMVPVEWQPSAAGVPSLRHAATIDFNLPTDGSGYGAHVDFSPILPHDGKLALKWFKDARQIFHDNGFDIFIGGHMFQKHSVLIHMILFNRNDEQHIKSVATLWNDLAAKAKEYHFTKYRSHLDHMDIVQETYNFNNNAYRRFVERLKDSIDPNGILSPGKQGIWPKKYRTL